MLLWIVIFLLIIAASLASIVYLVKKFYKLNITSKIASNNKLYHIAISCLPVIAIIALPWIIMGSMNSIVILIHLVLFSIISDLIFYLIGKYYKKIFSLNYALILAMSCTIVYLTIAWVLANNVWVTNYTLHTDKSVNNLRIIQFADSHIGTTFDGYEFNNYIKKMQKQNPDVVVITGDFVDDDTSKEDMKAACKALGTLHTTYGVYYSFGNHDKGYYGSDFRGYNGDDLIKELEKNNVRVLQDESVLIADSFYIIGRQDYSEADHDNKRATMKELLDGLDTSKYMIVLDHQPHDYVNQAESGIDLVLSGHTHGGQLIPLNIIGDLIHANDMTYGMKKQKDTTFIVTSGISDWALQFKSGCKSEFVVIDIEP